LKNKFGQRQLNEILSTVKVKTEGKSEDLIQNHSLKTQKIKIEKANVICDTLSTKRLRNSQLICKPEIKKEKKENLPKSTHYQIPSIRIPDVHKNEIEISWFDKFRLKHFRIMLENNLNVIINQHIEDHNLSSKVAEKGKQGRLIKKAVNEYKQNYKENSERMEYPKRIHNSQQKSVAKSIKMKTLEILLDKINLEMTLPRRDIPNLKNEQVYIEMRKILDDLVVKFHGRNITKRISLTRKIRYSSRDRYLIRMFNIQESFVLMPKIYV